MTNLRNLAAGLAFALAATGSLAWAQDEPVSYAETIAGLDQRTGLFNVYVDDGDGRILAELTPQDDGSLGRMIYTAWLASGLGSNPVGLDRGLGTDSEILRFFRVNDRVFAEFENYRYEAIGADAPERQATEQSFARSIVWSGEIVAEQNGRVLVDLSGFLTRDPVGTVAQLDAAGQGSFSIDSDRSAALTGSVHAFPLNVEIDALLTLQSSEPGSEVRAVTPSANSVTLTIHHSFAALPEAGYQTREADDRAGAISTEIYDMAAPLDAPVRRHLAIRHRLERIDPAAASGPVVEPIVYYVERGTPPVIRDALIEGAGWWADAFSDAGFEDAFRVELLPEGADPLDLRYNIIQWVHRQTRGWSYGGAVIDPRTGEILKGHVILGSQRIRQDRIIFEGLLGTAHTGTGEADDPLELALARIRQLAAHEVGHTLGLMHNFAASANDRASVMDYPAPRVSVDASGAFDVSQAYARGTAAWDRTAISWLYAQYADPAAEAEGQEAILARAHAVGLLYITDMHARGNDAAHPLANLWDDGSDPAQALIDIMAVRAQALANFGPQALASGQPASDLRAVFSPIYLYHRYQVEAAAKTLGGVYFEYELNGPSVRGLRPAGAAEQMRALRVLVNTLDPAVLDIPETVLSQLMPSPSGDYDAAATREMFSSSQYPAFSRSDAAAAAARITLEAMLSPARLARMTDQHSRDPEQLSAADLLSVVEGSVFTTARGEASRLAPLRTAIEGEYIAQLLSVTASGPRSSANLARAHLEALAAALPTGRSATAGSREDRIGLARQIEAGLARIDRGEDVGGFEAEIPPGSPIGADSCWHCDSAGLLGLGR
ncbi:zinc-dependent metalloprotease [uncultured Maricaulis sp.]|uniref:zinc-dependent metalloprotease n=1 Tax=uncultured Maricaulis sp. TaxID=174710 RepID=UPI0030D7DE16